MRLDPAAFAAELKSHDPARVRRALDSTSAAVANAPNPSFGQEEGLSYTAQLYFAWELLGRPSAQVRECLLAVLDHPTMDINARREDGTTLLIGCCWYVTAPPPPRRTTPTAATLPPPLTRPSQVRRQGHHVLDAHGAAGARRERAERGSPAQLHAAADGRVQRPRALGRRPAGAARAAAAAAQRALRDGLRSRHCRVQPPARRGPAAGRDGAARRGVGGGRRGRGRGGGRPAATEQDGVVGPAVDVAPSGRCGYDGSGELRASSLCRLRPFTTLLTPTRSAPPPPPPPRTS